MTPNQLLALAALAVVWLAVAFPSALKTRNNSTQGSITGFSKAMSALSGKSSDLATSTRRIDWSQWLDWVDWSELRVDVTARFLRRLLVGALTAVAVTGLSALIWGGAWWTLFVVALVVAGGYVTLLRHRKLEADRARRVIRSIHSAGHGVVEGQPAVPDLDHDAVSLGGWSASG